VKQRDLEFDVPEPERPPALPRRRVQSVSEVTERIRDVLESELRDVWVEGEISNLKIASSGHWYFSLKDDKAQLRAVVWKNSARRIRFQPKDGLKVVARGGIRVYAPRGEYQISVELLEPLGKGSLQQAFEDLKKRLEQEGLFDPRRKRPLPLLPRRIGVVTSPTGAVVRDILRVLERRYANLEVLIYPARVQGNEATREIVEGVRTLGGMAGLDVLMVARGGGSIEDLWAFNEEAVARALAASPIPTISAVGHETDFTIADFVADVRAPTPSAAAELVIGAKEDIEARIGGLQTRLTGAVRLRLTRTRHRVEAVTSHRVFEAERGRVRTRAQQVDDLQRRSEAALERHVERQRQRNSYYGCKYSVESLH
jgi:exodeoxyribonuclease VII large subunit